MSGFGASEVARDYREDAERLKTANQRLRTALRKLRTAADWYHGDGTLDEAKKEADSVLGMLS